jgi:hypothetical protein
MRLFTLQYISLTPPLHFSTELEFVFHLSDIGLTFSLPRKTSTSSCGQSSFPVLGPKFRSFCWDLMFSKAIHFTWNLGQFSSSMHYDDPHEVTWFSYRTWQQRGRSALDYLLRQDIDSGGSNYTRRTFPLLVSFYLCVSRFEVYSRLLTRLSQRHLCST